MLTVPLLTIRIVHCPREERGGIPIKNRESLMEKSGENSKGCVATISKYYIYRNKIGPDLH
jgi:hypothetical protein